MRPAGPRASPRSEYPTPPSSDEAVCAATPMPPVTDAEDVYVSEVFSAIQGEGALVGTRQVFVRLTGCNIRCAYCDQPEALERVGGPCRIERTAGSGTGWSSPVHFRRGTWWTWLTCSAGSSPITR